MLESKTGVLYISYDESNHGRFPEICVSVFSHNPADVLKYSSPTSKKHSLKDNFLPLLISRDYNILLLNQSEKNKINEKELLGRILASLTYSKLQYSHSELNFFIDGQWQKPKLDYARDIIREITSMNKNKIKLKCGKDFDKLYPLVNLADQIAYWHFKNSTPETLSSNIHLVSLLTE